MENFINSLIQAMPYGMQRFLYWYLSPTSRLGRGSFNWIVAIATLPVVILQVWDFSDTARGMANQMSNPTSMLSGGLSPDVLQQALTGNVPVGSEAQQQLSQYAAQAAHPTEPQPATPAAADYSAGWDVSLLNLLVTLSLVPILMMRLRDMAWSPYLWVMILLPVLLEFFGHIFHFVVSTEINVALAGTSFILLFWMCLAASDRD